MTLDELQEAAVQADLTTAWLGRRYDYVATLDSTNERMKARVATSGVADAAYPAGAVLLTDFQSAGRGRLDRRWEAPPGSSLLLSVLLRPPWPARRGPWLTMLAGLAVAEAIEEVTGISAGLKWPNDVVLADDAADDSAAESWRKVCGLLLDVTFDAAGDRLQSAILGIGLNVNIPAAALPEAATPATSLLVAGGRPVARRPLLVTLLRRLEGHYEAALAGRSPVDAWSARLVTLGRRVIVTAADTAAPLRGTAEAVDEWGCLLVRDDAGRRHTIAAGDVSLRGN
ncbi:MAG: biotin--[acetyl-CoA-carboxylase] ligase [Candidatus Promineofilum sp.]|nr:biotin--[acetyl-CoA-carboxylase] ligase [Promineifilum sp.]